MELCPRTKKKKDEKWGNLGVSFRILRKNGGKDGNGGSTVGGGGVERPAVVCRGWGK
jgi:hypothetical protein